MRPRFYFWLIITTILFSCASAKKNFEQGRYDAAIEQAVRKLRKNPGNQKMIDLLYDAYRIANEKDQNAIKKLENENKEANSESIYLLYSKLEQRQQMVRETPELQPENISKDYHFQLLDYSDELAAYKQKTLNYLTNTGKIYLAKEDRFSAREAFAYFERGLSYDPGNPELSDLYNQALNKGYTWVNVNYGGFNGMQVPYSLQSQLNMFNTEAYNSGWVRFNPINTSDDAHYEIYIEIGQVSISPERVREKQYEESKTVEDGFVYEYDSKGKKILDAEGRPVTKPVYKKVNVKVVKVEMSKECAVVANVILVNKSNGNVISRREVYGRSSFYHVYGLMNGDQRALSDESIKLLKISAPVPFPAQEEMVAQAAPAFVNAVGSEIRSRLYDIP